MKTLTTVLVCVIFLSTSCKKSTDELYAFPTEIGVNNTDCLQSWNDIEFQISNHGTKIYMYQVYGWFGTKEDSIQVNQNKFDFSSGGTGFKFIIPQKSLENNTLIFIQLNGFSSDKGGIGTSKIYKFQKDNINGCVKWRSI